MSLSSMVLLQIDPDRVRARPFEGDAPWPVHMDRVAHWLAAAQPVEIEARQVHLLRTLRLVERGQPAVKAVGEPRIDPATRSPLPHFLEASVPKALEHAARAVSLLLTIVHQPLTPGGILQRAAR